MMLIFDQFTINISQYNYHVRIASFFGPKLFDKVGRVTPDAPAVVHVHP